jgi:uncharacterized protein DUF5681
MSNKRKRDVEKNRRGGARDNRLAKSLKPNMDIGAEVSRIGYGRPPEQSQFKPGKSGNPKGRPKASRNLKTIIRNALTSSVILREGEKKRSVSKLEGIVLRQLESALKGNEKAALTTLKMAGQVGLLDSGDVAGDTPILSATEQAILNEIFDRSAKNRKSKP